MAVHFSILVWRILWTEEPGGLQSIGLQRVGHHWSDWACTRARVNRPTASIRPGQMSTNEQTPRQTASQNKTLSSTTSAILSESSLTMKSRTSLVVQWLPNLPLQGVWDPFLVWELRFYMPCGSAKKQNKNPQWSPLGRELTSPSRIQREMQFPFCVSNFIIFLIRPTAVISDSGKLYNHISSKPLMYPELKLHHYISMRTCCSLLHL